MKRVVLSKSLFLSLVVIILMWVMELVQNLFFIDKVLDLYKSLPQFFLYAFLMGIFCVLVVTLLLRFSREKFREIGFTNERIWKQIKIGALLGILIFVLQTFLIHPICSALLPKTQAQGVKIGNLFASLSYLPILILLSMFKGGFSEEIWRIFALTRFEKCFGKTGLILVLVIGSMMFGVGHLYQGIAGMASIAIIGFLYSIVYLRKRSALEAMVAHGTFDLVGIVLGFVIYYGK